MFISVSCQTDGHQVAVKVFNKNAYRRPLDVQRREFDLLKQLNHINIVRLITIEPEVSGARSLVRELHVTMPAHRTLNDYLYRF